MPKILIISDAWLPQINGVVTTLTNVKKELEKSGYEVEVFSPEDCRIKFPLPFYPEITLGIPSKKKIKKRLDCEPPDFIHISTPEGPIGSRFRHILDKRKWNYTTGYHTKFPEFVKSIIPILPISWGHKFMKFVNRKSKKIMVPTPSMIQELTSMGYLNVVLWGRGYNSNRFYPKHTPNKTPIFLCVSRVSVEKNLESFFKLNLPGKKIMVGDGPAKKQYEKKYSDTVEFVGMKKGKELTKYYQLADVFVFPSKKDTFGVVMVESLACGTPVAAYKVTGPKDVVKNGINGWIGNDLNQNAIRCLEINRNDVYETSKQYTWKKSSQDFFQNLVKTK